MAVLLDQPLGVVMGDEGANFLYGVEDAAMDTLHPGRADRRPAMQRCAEAARCAARSDGGRIIVEVTPEQAAVTECSPTGCFLAPLLAEDRLGGGGANVLSHHHDACAGD